MQCEEPPAGAVTVQEAVSQIGRAVLSGREDRPGAIAARNPVSDLLENEVAQELAAASLILIALLRRGAMCDPDARADVETVNKIVIRGIETCVGLASVLEASTKGGKKDGWRGSAVDARIIA
jgi:hypothetical protein